MKFNVAYDLSIEKNKIGDNLLRKTFETIGSKHDICKGSNLKRGLKYIAEKCGNISINEIKQTYKYIKVALNNVKLNGYFETNDYRTKKVSTKILLIITEIINELDDIKYDEFKQYLRNKIKYYVTGLFFSSYNGINGIMNDSNLRKLLNSNVNYNEINSLFNELNASNKPI